MLVRQRRRETSRLLLPVVLAALGACLVPPPPPCGPSNCEGCCAGTTCMAGLVDTQCGREGAACGACASGTTCAAGVCQAGGTGGGAGGSAAGGSSAGGSAAGGPGDGGSPYALFLRAAAEAACQHLDCDLSIPAGVRAAECPTVISEGFAVNVLSPVRSVDLGYRTFDPDAGARCLAAIRTAPCGHSFPPLDCYLVTRAVAPTGGACDTNKDCANGLDGCHGPACSRRCGPGGGLNEPCRGTTCDHGLRCAMGRCEPELDAGAPCSDSCGRDLVCVSSVCAPAPGPGSPCLRGRCNGVAYCSVTNQCLARKPLAQACSFDGECVEGLVCVRAACAPPVGRGGACRSTSECAPGLACDDITNSCEPMQRVDSNGSCSSTRLCPGFEECFGQVRVFDGGVGQLGRCRREGPGDPCPCSNGLFCNGGTCAVADAGTPCVRAVECPPGFQCRAGSCSPPSPAQPCTRDLECLPTEACVQGQCGRVPTLGEPCNSRCARPAVCARGQCVLGGHPGELCLLSAICFEGTCALDGGFATPGALCAGRLPNGSVCGARQECISDYCSNSSELSLGQCAPACP